MEKHMHDHAEMLKAVRHELPKDEMLCDLADLFKLCGAAGYDPVGNFAPVKGIKAEQFDCLPQRGQNNLLFPCR